MPDLVGNLRHEVSRAIDLARAGETIRAYGVADPKIRNELTLFRLHLIYEMAYLHVFVNWEAFLEESFLRYLCGYPNKNGQILLVAGTYSTTLLGARGTLLAGRPYMLWHGAATIEQRSRRYFLSGPHETVIASSHARMEWFAAVRHYIAHKQLDARMKFDTACMNLCGRRFRGSRPGAFLRDTTITGGLPLRWLELIAQELLGLAGQILPM